MAITGRMGTLNEFTIAYDERRPIGVLKASGGIGDHPATVAKKSGKKGPRII